MFCGIVNGAIQPRQRTMKKLNFTTQNKAAHVRKKNKDFLDLLDVATKARRGFVGEQSRLVSRSAKGIRHSNSSTDRSN